MTALVQLITSVVPMLLRGLTMLPALWTFIKSFRWVTSLVNFGFFGIGLPLAFQWGMYKFAERFAQPILMELNLSSQVLSLSGNAAWLADQLQLPFCLSVLMGFALQAFLLRVTAAHGMFSKITRY